ncbi:MAG TPA: glucoamylase family protein, partial [Bacteroidota bacterium]|nr:glucoamylase family protein [Bacteroidota bacterium]
MRACIISLLLAGACRVAGAQGETPRWDPFLDSLQQRTIRWFLTATPGATGLTPDRWPSRSPSSIAAVGFALTIYPIAVERGIITRTEAAARTRTTLRTLLDAPQNDGRTNVGGYRGLLYHFVAVADGTRAWNCELSTIDTALLIAGVLCDRVYFDGDAPAEQEIRALADSLERRVDWTWTAEGRPGIMLGWTPERGADKNSWHGYNEASIMYIIALGSPAHTVEKRVWDYWTSTYIWARY